MPPRLERALPFVGKGVAVMSLVSVPQYDSNRLTKCGGHAVVVGAGMAGLLAARVLADVFEALLDWDQTTRGKQGD